jgi:hypothetical protein
MFFVLDFGFRNGPIKDTASSALINVEILTIPPLGKLGSGIVLLEVIFNTLSEKKKTFTSRLSKFWVSHCYFKDDRTPSGYLKIKVKSKWKVSVRFHFC